MKGKLRLLTFSISSVLLLLGCAKETEDVHIKNNLQAIGSNIIIKELNSELENVEVIPVKIVENTPEPTPLVTEVNIKMVGDNLIHSPLYKAARRDDGTYDFDMLFEHMKDDIESADLAIINQETILTADRNQISSYPMFGSPLEVGNSVVNAGFDIVAHATNHTMDKNKQGILDTINFWETNYPNVIYLGIHDSAEDSDIAYVKKKGINFAFVNYTYGLNGLENWRVGSEYMVDMLTDSDIESTLLEAETNADMTIAVLHVGNEYVYEPTTYAQQQVDRFIDNGADIVLCAHPHVLEPYEMRTTEKGNTGLVYYSLGNYVSNQNELPRILGGMADITIRKTEYNGECTIEIPEYNMIPLVTHQEVGYFTTYKLEDYTDELAAKHKLKSKGLSVEYLNELYSKIIN